MNPPRPLHVEQYWTTGRIGAAVGLSLVLVAGLAVGVMASPAWDAKEDDSCQVLAIYHYAEASRGGPDAQDHMYGAWAAEALQRAGETCPEVP